MSNAAALRAVDMPQHECPRGVLLPFLVEWPFLLSFVADPSTGVWPLLASWSCVALMVMFTLTAGLLTAPSVPLSVWLLMTALLVALGSDALPQLMFGALLAVVVVGLAACAGTMLASDPSRTRSLCNWLAKGLLAAGLISALLGFLQYYGLADPLATWTTAPDVGQAYSNLRQRSQFASLISISLIAAFWLCATGTSHR